MAEQLSASLEDYLEAIYHIVESKGAARPKDIAGRLGVGNSSVTGALKALAERTLVNYAPYDVVTLTPAGEEVALDVVHRHETLREFFVKVLAADAGLAEDAACRVEHAMPPEMVERLVRFIEFVELCPRGGPALLDGFRFHLDAGCRPACFDRCPAEPVGVDPAPGTTRTLRDLAPGERARVVRVGGAASLRRRLTDLGLTAGAPVAVERKAPLGDPIEIEVRGSHLSLRREEAAQVAVEDDH